MTNKNQHVVPHNGEWAVRGEGNQKVTATFPTQQEAINRATEIARNQQSELFIHRPNGQIRERNSYGNDPDRRSNKREAGLRGGPRKSSCSTRGSS